jgi:hypothetical protein
MPLVFDVDLETNPMDNRADVALQSLTVVDFAPVSSSPESPLAPVESTKHNPAKHGNWAQWAAVLLALVNIALYLSTRSEQKASISSDDHLQKAIGEKFDPFKAELERKFEKIDGQFADLSGKIGHVQGQMDELNARAGKLATSQDELRRRVDGQEAVTRVINPNRIFATIQGEIEMAEKERRPIPPSELADYKLALLSLPSNKGASIQPNASSHFWITAAAIINYQSRLNQLGGNAPDPEKVAKPCIPPNWRHNLIQGGFRDCVVSLDTNSFRDVTFVDSVIIYKGGGAVLDNVTFVNCAFKLDLPSGSQPKELPLMTALLESTDQKKIEVRP